MKVKKDSGAVGYRRADVRRRSRDIVISIVDDPVQSTVVAVLLTVVGAVFVLGGLCIWPYLMSGAWAGGAFDSASAFGKTVILGALSGVIGLMVAVYFCWFYDWEDNRSFSLMRIWLIVYAVELLANWIMMPIFGVDMLAVSDAVSGAHILSVLFHGILGIAMALVPSFLTALAGYAANTLWYMTHKHLL